MENKINIHGVKLYSKNQNLSIDPTQNILNNNDKGNFKDFLDSAQESYNTGYIPEIKNDNNPNIISSVINTAKTSVNKLDDLSNKILNKSASVSETVSTAIHAEALIKTIVTVSEKMRSSLQEILKMNI